MKLTLSHPALDIINNYLKLPFPRHNVSCPYFNNRRANVRGALKALNGKGSVEDIMEEAMIISLREKINLQNLSSEEIKKILVDHNLGIDCSGFVYYILDAELRARGKEPLKKYLQRPWIKNPIRKLIAVLRPVENTGVSTFNSDANSVEVELKDVRPGDLIIMLNTGRNHDFHHVLIVTNVIPTPTLRRGRDLSKPSSDEIPQTNVGQSFNSLKDSSSPSTNSGSLGMVIEFTHSFQFSTDGQYNHGIKRGRIEILDINKNLLEQKWIDETPETLLIDMTSETLEHARLAKKLSIRRLKPLQ